MIPWLLTPKMDEYIDFARNDGNWKMYPLSNLASFCLSIHYFFCEGAEGEILFRLAAPPKISEHLCVIFPTQSLFLVTHPRFFGAFVSCLFS